MSPCYRHAFHVLVSGPSASEPASFFSFEYTYYISTTIFIIHLHFYKPYFAPSSLLCTSLNRLLTWSLRFALDFTRPTSKLGDHEPFYSIVNLAPTLMLSPWTCRDYTPTCSHTPKSTATASCVLSSSDTHVQVHVPQGEFEGPRPLFRSYYSSQRTAGSNFPTGQDDRAFRIPQATNRTQKTSTLSNIYRIHLILPLGPEST